MWVRDHISSFGGNGADVTIFGESAGGNSVLHHLVQPASFGLYSKAIIESGTYDAGYSFDAAEAFYKQALTVLDCGSDPKGALACLLNSNASKLEWATDPKVWQKLNVSLAYQHWGPVVDGVSMTATPQDLVAAGKFNNKVPVLIGSNRDEFAAFITGGGSHILD